MQVSQEQLLAFVVYELRLHLAEHLGSNSGSPSHLRAAAHLAYALHNQALSVMAGKSFDVADAVASIDAVDKMLGVDFRSRLQKALGQSA